MFHTTVRLGTVALAIAVLVLAASPAQADTIKGRVYHDVNNDGDFDAGTDMGVGGVTVEMTDMAGEPVPNGTATTDADGNYEFAETVTPASTGGEINLTLTNLPSIPPPPPGTMPFIAGGSFQINMGMPMPTQPPREVPTAGPVPVMSEDETPTDVCIPVVNQGGADPEIIFTDDGQPPLKPWPVEGFINRDVGSCNGEHDAGLDEDIVGRAVSLVIISPAGQAQPMAVTSGAQGRFSFPGILNPDLMSNYMLMVITTDENNMPVMKMVTVTFTPAIPNVRFAQMRHDTIRVFAECRLGNITGRVTDADGQPVVNRRLDVCRITAAGEDPVPGMVMTNANGDYDTGPLDDGNYRIKVTGEGDPAPSATRIVSGGQTSADTNIVLAGEEPPEACREACSGRGHVHEVVVATDVWVGASPGSMAVSAALYRNCRARTILDVASIGYQGTQFPGPVTGIDDIITIEAVTVQNGFATVQVKVVADQGTFPSGAFLNNRRQIRVTVNGRWNRACPALRCNTASPGSHLGRYRVFDNWGWDSWKACTGSDAMLPAPPPKKDKKRKKNRRRGRSDKSDKSGKSDKSSGKSGRSDKSGKSGRSSYKSGKSDKSSHRAHKRGKKRGKKHRRSWWCPRWRPWR